MTRRHKQSDALSIFVMIVGAVIAALAAGAYVLTYLIVAVYALGYIRYCVIKRAQISYGAPEVAEGYASYTHVQLKLHQSLNLYSDFKMTVHDRYDERNPLARDANNKIDTLRSLLRAETKNFEAVVQGFNKAIFYRYAFGTYGLVLVAYKAMLEYFPAFWLPSTTTIFATVASLFVGFWFYKTQSVTIHNAKNRLEKQQISVSKGSLLVSGALGALGCLIAFSLATTNIPRFLNDGLQLANQAAPSVVAEQTRSKHARRAHTESLSEQPQKIVSADFLDNDLTAPAQGLLEGNVPVTDNQAPIQWDDEPMAASRQAKAIKTNKPKVSLQEDIPSRAPIKLMAPSPGFVMSDVRLVDSPNAKASILSKLKSGEEVIIIGRSNDSVWYLVEANPNQGQNVKGFVLKKSVAMFK